MARFALRGPAASSGSPRGIWNAADTYAKGDTVSYLTGAYMALVDIPAGASSPAVDTARWMQLPSGAGLVAGPAKLTTNFAFAMNAGVLQDVTGMVLPIPAGSPPCEVVAKAMMVQFVFGAAAGAAQQATLRLLLVDEGNVAVGQSIVRVVSGANSATIWQQSQVSADLAATAAAKTIKLSGWLDTITNLTSCTLWAGAGTGTPPGTATLGPVKMDAKAR